tara:strand:+ start:632 stop:1495 length:864 start_codon:yes stop_codon:yes gene_type:complete
MVIVKFIGGLGNQMFQYAFYRFLESHNIEVSADISDYKTYNLHNGFEIEEIFNIHIKKASSVEILRVKDGSRKLIKRLRRKLFGLKSTHIIQNHFTLDLLKKNNSFYFDGYWQSEPYVFPVKEIVKKEFLFNNEMNEDNSKVLKEIQSSLSISLHVRRGDYLKKENINIYAQCKQIYYETAINFFEKKYKDVSFFVFSDDIDWVKKNLSFSSNYTFIEHNTGKNSFEDLRLMSSCKHHIIANSSFSWWGAFLGQDTSETICPKLWWVDEKRNKDIFIPESWIRLNNH